MKPPNELKDLSIAPHSPKTDGMPPEGHSGAVSDLPPDQDAAGEPETAKLLGGGSEIPPGHLDAVAPAAGKHGGGSEIPPGHK